MANSAITRMAAAALAAACCAFVGGCGKDEAPKEEAAATPEAYKRIRDAEYIEALEKQRGEQKDITRRIVALQAELDKSNRNLEGTRFADMSFADKSRALAYNNNNSMEE